MFGTIDPVVASALSAMGGTALGFLLGLIKDRIQRKAEEPKE